MYSYSDQIREKFERVDNIRIRLELDSKMQAILSKDAGVLAKLVCQENGNDVNCTSLLVPLQNQTVTLSRVIDLHSPSDKLPVYVGIVQLPDGHIMLADWRNKTCCLYNPSYKLVTSHILLENPYNMCLIEDDEVAVTFSGKTVQFLTVKDGSIRNSGMASTKYEHCGVDAVTRKELLVYGHCGDTMGSNKYYWSLITKNGDVTLHHEFDCKPTLWAYAALDMSKSRVYMSVSGDNAVYCFGLRDGKQYFVYISRDLKAPRGISVDREDNVYVVGYRSNNIHKLSPDGVTIQKNWKIIQKTAYEFGKDLGALNMIMKISSFTVRATRLLVVVHVFLDHKACQNVLQFRENLSGLLKEMHAHKITKQLRQLEDHLKNFMEVNEENIDILESHVNNTSAEIGDIKRKLNDILDNIEKTVKLEGNRIYKEWLITKQEQNHQCQSLLSAIRNSQSLLNTIGQYGSDTQKFW
ncbi:hypothetical protein CHS0354_032147 [Potamilus streckersoni]|uniref:Uncharacterized protein n=1 Tax=Potamilus streckersoni TaxID=2493646 RepID=A0AAE0TGP5_9BIVA|nr:hypothetical protein CHS0354_032147 [Potamilus streckersoni]